MEKQADIICLKLPQSFYWMLPKTSSFWLTRILFLRSLAFIYGVAFLVAYNQNQGLLGPKGLLPTDVYLSRISHQLPEDSFLSKFMVMPTLLWAVDYTSQETLTTFFDTASLIGLIVSIWVFVFGCANIILMLLLWILYHSIVAVGQRWYSFGWESQLLETGFLAIFLCPMFEINDVPKHLPTPEVAVLGYRWLIFRIMIGAGLIKIRGDQCWRDLTCMNYHYETQPVPNPLSTFFHQSPEWWHMSEVLGNHFVELIAPFALLALPFRRVVIFGGIVQVLFQVILILSGNLSFLNWLTILPAIFCFDDQFLQFCFSYSKRREAAMAALHQHGQQAKSVLEKLVSLFYSIAHWLVFGLIMYLSIPVIQNLLSSRQMMNTSFDTFRLVNTYGAFGSITKQRTEIVFEGTLSSNPENPNTVWKEYHFKCKPGNLTKTPCLISPYHYRLDWLMWFAAFGSYQQHPWLLHLAGKFLDNDKALLSSLIQHNPFENDHSPKFIRALHYTYQYSKYGSKSWSKGQWWIRKTDINKFYLPPVNKNSLLSIYNQFGWTN